MINEAKHLSAALLRLAEDKVDEKKRDVSCSTSFPYVKAAMPSKMIMPLQDALTCSLPVGSEGVSTHNPFPFEPVLIDGECNQTILANLRHFRSDRSHAIPSAPKENYVHWQRWEAISIPMQTSR